MSKALIAAGVAAALAVPAAAVVAIGAADAQPEAAEAAAEAPVATRQQARTIVAEGAFAARQVDAAPQTVRAARRAAEAARPLWRALLADAQSEALAARYTPAYAKSYARSYMRKHYGWGTGEYQALVSLWTRESNWDYTAENPTSGAYGIPQSLPATKMASEGKDWRSNPEPQIRWGLKYIRDTYGSPSATVAFWDSNGWY